MSLFLSHPHWYKASVRLSEVFEASSSALALTSLAFAVTAAEALPSSSDPALKSRLQARVGELTQLAKHALPDQTADIQRALRWVRRVPAVVATRADQMVLLLRHAAALERRQQRTEDVLLFFHYFLSASLNFELIVHSFHCSGCAVLGSGTGGSTILHLLGPSRRTRCARDPGGDLHRLLGVLI
jgi:hypothetical protein